MSNVQMIPIKKIHVLNPRARSKAKFSEIVTNVSKVGLKKPITVCPRTGSGGEYDLVCGQGRLEAFAQLGATHVPALVVDASAEDRYVMSLVEIFARRPPDSLDLCRNIAGLEQRGYTANQIAEKIGVSDTYVREILRLHAQGEEQLLAAVERGDLPISVAATIAAAKDDDVKRCLAEAYERGELKGQALARARIVVERRLANVKRFGRHGNTPPSRRAKKLSADDLIRSVKRATQRQALLVKKARLCEGMLRLVTGAMRELASDDHFVTLLRAEGLEKMPKYLADEIRRKAGRA